MRTQSGMIGCASTAPYGVSFPVHAGGTSSLVLRARSSWTSLAISSSLVVFVVFTRTLPNQMHQLWISKAQPSLGVSDNQNEH